MLTSWYSLFCCWGCFMTRFGFLFHVTEQPKETTGSLTRPSNSTKLTEKEIGNVNSIWFALIVTCFEFYINRIDITLLQGWPDRVQWTDILYSPHANSSKLFKPAFLEKRWCDSYDSGAYGSGRVSLLLVPQSTAPPLSLLSLPFSSPFFNCHRAHYLSVLILFIYLIPYFCDIVL